MAFLADRSHKFAAQRFCHQARSVTISCQLNSNTVRPSLVLKGIFSRLKVESDDERSTLSIAPAKIVSSSKLITTETLLAWFGCAILLVALVVLIDHPPLNERTDFSVTYIGSRMVYLGMGAKVYDLAEQDKLKRLLLPDAQPLIFEHPPFEALLLSPIGALSYKTAYLLWGLINIAIWLSLAYLLRRYVTVPQDNIVYLLLWLLFVPLLAALFEGQSSLVMFLLYSVTFIELRSGRDLRAGAVFGLALFKFQFAIPFMLILLLQRRWRFVQGFLGTATALGLLSLLAVGWRGVAAYIHLITAVAAHPESASYGNAIGMATVGGFVNPLLGRTIGHGAASLLIAGISIGLLIVTAGTWKSKWKRPGFASAARESETKSSPTFDPSFDLMFAAAIVVSLATSLHMFTPDLSPLLLPMLIVVGYFPARAHSWLRITLALPLVIFWMPPLFFLLLVRHWFYLLFPVLMLFLAGIVKLAGMAPERIEALPIADSVPGSL